jgi:putative membrane protein
MPDRGPATGASQRSGRGAAEFARLLVAVTVGALVAVFAVLNTGEVEVNWIFGTFRTPLIIVILVCLAVGLAAGLAGGGLAARGRSRSRQRRSDA